MAIDVSVLATHTDNANAASYVVPSYTPSADELILAWISTTLAALPAAPTASGNNLTWVEAATRSFSEVSGVDRYRITVLRAMGASPTTGTLTISFGGQIQQDIVVAIVRVGGIDTSGTHGSGAIVQAVGAVFGPPAVATASITSAAFGSSTNGAIAGFSKNGTGVYSAGSGWGLLAQVGATSPNIRLGVESRASADTTADITWSGTDNAGGIALELKEAVGAGGLSIPVAMHSYRQRRVLV